MFSLILQLYIKNSILDICMCLMCVYICIIRATDEYIWILIQRNFDTDFACAGVGHFPACHLHTCNSPLNLMQACIMATCRKFTWPATGVLKESNMNNLTIIFRKMLYCLTNEKITDMCAQNLASDKVCTQDCKVIK